jgi:hypothetical protein
MLAAQEGFQDSKGCTAKYFIMILCGMLLACHNVLHPIAKYMLCCITADFSVASSECINCHNLLMLMRTQICSKPKIAQWSIGVEGRSHLH